MTSATSTARPFLLFLAILALAMLCSLAFGWLWEAEGRMIDRYYEPSAPTTLIEIFGFFALFALMFTIAGLVLSHDKRLHTMLWVGWVVIPPAWFVTEYYYIWPVHGIEDQFHHFQYAQSVAGKLWGAGVAVTSASFFRDKLARRGEAKTQTGGTGGAVSSPGGPAGGSAGTAKAGGSADSGSLSDLV